MPATGEVKTGFFITVGILLALVIVGFVIHFMSGS